MARYTITLIRPGGVVERCEGDEDLPILDSAEDEGFELRWGCRAGSCGSCVARLVEGEVEHEPQDALDDHHLDRGLVLLCSARPLSDCVVETDRFDDL